MVFNQFLIVNLLCFPYCIGYTISRSQCMLICAIEILNIIIVITFLQNPKSPKSLYRGFVYNDVILLSLGTLLHWGSTVKHCNRYLPSFQNAPFETATAVYCTCKFRLKLTSSHLPPADNCYYLGGRTRWEGQLTQKFASNSKVRVNWIPITYNMFLNLCKG